MKRQITKESLELIRHFEGFYPRPYLCPAKVPTIGIGTIAYPNGKKVTLADSPITEEKAYEYLLHELEEKADRVHDFLIRKAIILNDQQYSALVSFAYNCGVGPIVDSGRSLNQAILSGSRSSVKEAFMMYNKVTKRFLGVPRKVELPGLTRRRKAELELYFS